MMPGRWSLAAASGRIGRDVSIAVVDSGVHGAHPHVGGIAGGASVDAAGAIGADTVDRLGHGTAVAAAIREKAPASVVYAVKVFDQTLSTTGVALDAAIRWAADRGITLINLSLGTTNPAHEAVLAAAVAYAAERGATVVAAAPQDGAAWLPGGLAGVVGVEVDWTRARDECGVHVGADGGLRLSASGFPRPLAGVPPERNFRGPSFAVANATGLIAVAIEGRPARSLADIIACLGGTRSSGGA